MAKYLQDNPSFLKANRKSSLCEAESTTQHWEKTHICPTHGYIAWLYCYLPCLEAKCHVCSLIVFSVHSDEE